MLPPLDSRGLLPRGVHDARPHEIATAFCINVHRQELFSRFVGFFPVLRARLVDCPLIHPMPDLVAGGSFFSDKEIPCDIELAIVLKEPITPSWGWYWVMENAANHQHWKEVYSVDFYPSLSGTMDFVAFFSYVGPKTAADKQLGVKDLRGTVRLQSW